MKDNSRQHWLRVDFQNWKDEDDIGDEKEPFEEVIFFKHCTGSLHPYCMLKHIEHLIVISTPIKVQRCWEKANDPKEF